MNARVKRFVTTSTLAISIALGMSACAPFVTVEGRPAASSSSTNSPMKTKAEAKKTVDAMFAQIGIDLAEYQKTVGASKSEPEKNEIFDEAFKESLAYFDQSVPIGQSRKLITSFSQLYLYDKNAKIDSNEDDYEITGDTAKIKASDFTLTLGGNKQDQSKDSTMKTTMNLSFVNEKWVVSGFGQE